MIQHMPDVRGQLLPIYVLADESASMRHLIGELNAGLVSLHQALLAEPMAAAKVRFTVIGFSDTAVLRMHLADLRRVDAMPPLTSRNATSFGAAFQALLQQIPADVRQLKSQQYAVHRPAVFFLSDGQPSDGGNWRRFHQQLVDRNQTLGAPNIIACGIGDAEARTILEVATRPEYAFVSIQGSDIGQAIAKFCAALTKSVVESGRSMANGTAELRVDRPEGFHMAIDVV
ncbi:hypothetical protein V1634_06300 [Plantactinospora veratri]|uniref:VWFA domain-containing protein n=1 Tax=Plantactinospora veratri TaxID=1436122 RepID=A0ABU7S920_9ACTN